VAGEPVVFQQITAPLLVVDMVTVCALEYVPAPGEKVGAAAAPAKL
jgi:hypothetical protein